MKVVEGVVDSAAGLAAAWEQVVLGVLAVAKSTCQTFVIPCAID
jgi:hypothetical protein